MDLIFRCVNANPPRNVINERLCNLKAHTGTEEVSLRAYLERQAVTTFKPENVHTVIPRIFTNDVAGLVDFLRIVFGAHGKLRSEAPTEMRIGDSIVMISSGGSVREPMPACLYVYVEDTDDAYRPALAAGAESIESPANMPYGDRRATIRDRWANIWQIATYRGENTERQRQARGTRR